MTAVQHITAALVTVTMDSENSHFTIKPLSVVRYMLENSVPVACFG